MLLLSGHISRSVQDAPHPALIRGESVDHPTVGTQHSVSTSVTSVVSMLKDTLERKKLGSHANMDTTSHGNSFRYYDNQQFQQNILGGANIFPQGTIAHVEDSLMLSDIRKSTEHNTGNFVYPANQVWISAVSREPSQSGSSNAMTTQSAGYEVCDELPAMGQALSVCESTRRNTANGTADCRSKGKEYRERVLK